MILCPRNPLMCVSPRPKSLSLSPDLALGRRSGDSCFIRRRVDGWIDKSRRAVTRKPIDCVYAIRAQAVVPRRRMECL